MAMMPLWMVVTDDGTKLIAIFRHKHDAEWFIKEKKDETLSLTETGGWNGQITVSFRTNK